jgi:hypothetical protein
MRCYINEKSDCSLNLFESQTKIGEVYLMAFALASAATTTAATAAGFASATAGASATLAALTALTAAGTTSATTATAALASTTTLAPAAALTAFILIVCHVRTSLIVRSCLVDCYASLCRSIGAAWLHLLKRSYMGD